MKTRFLPWIFLIFVCCHACTEPAKPVETVSKDDPVGSAIPTYTITCPDCELTDSDYYENGNCIHDRQVKTICATAWTQAWRTTMASDSNMNSKRVISKVNLQNLYRQNSASALRVYLGFKGDSLILIFANVDTTNCNPLITSTVYATTSSQYSDASASSGGVQINQAVTACAYIRNWKDTIAPSGNAPYDTLDLLPIRAYTFSWTVITTLMDNSTNALIFEPGLYKLNSSCVPQGIFPFPEYVSADSLRYNVDIMVSPDNPDLSNTYANFARPCPNFCGSSLFCD